MSGSRSTTEVKKRRRKEAKKESEPVSFPPQKTATKKKLSAPSLSLSIPEKRQQRERQWGKKRRKKKLKNFYLSTIVQASFLAHPEKCTALSSPIIISSMRSHAPRRTLPGSSKVEAISPPVAAARRCEEFC